ncbi:hypothetical protein [Streptomyces griseofuscus]|uniref:hypothetical protein n=1 Tax=Streptomyces griseofuscus TaxID=146922 RepID=UPI000F654B11|nr:hypothetical protein [Streptomyces griseofuscus]
MPGTGDQELADLIRPDPIPAQACVSHEGDTHLPAMEREITWVDVSENKSQGGRITAWRGKMHVMAGDTFYVIA